MGREQEDERNIGKLTPRVNELWKLKGNFPNFRNLKMTCHDKNIPSKEINNANTKERKSTGYNWP